MLKEAAGTYGKSARRKTKSILSSAQDVVAPRKLHLQDLPIPYSLKEATFAHLFIANDPPEDHDLNSLKEALKTTQSLLVRQESDPGTTHRTSSFKVVRLENGIMMLKSVLSIIRRVPREILQLIFTLDLPTPNAVFPQQYIPPDQLSRPWTLSQVCRTWRHVALSTPELWNYLPRLHLQRFNSSGDCQRQRQQLNFMVQHSKDLPLHFFIYAETQQLSGNQRLILELVSLHAERWGSVVICANMTILAVFNSIKGRLAQLRRLSLFLPWSPSELDLDIFSVAPNLRDVFLKGHFRELRLPTSAQLTHYEALLDPMVGGIGHALSSVSTLQTLILQGTSLSPLESTVTLPSLKEFSFRFDAALAHPGALSHIVLPALEEIVICGDHQQILTTTLSLLKRSASAAKQTPFPLKKIHLPAFGAALFIDEDPQIFLSILETAPCLQTLETSLLPVEVLQRLEKIESNELIVPALECLEFVVQTLPSSDQIAALNRIAAIRCEREPEGTHKAFKFLKALTLYDEYNHSSEARLMRCHQRLEEWWNKSEPSESIETRTPSIASSRSGSADSYRDSSSNTPPSPLDVLRDLITPVANTGKPGLPIADAFIYKHHISKQQTKEIISQLDKCRDAINVTDISVSFSRDLLALQMLTVRF
ncbi:hypothetical protein BJ165DRAFT_901945 [Panaeolus papilionaceus]|nr:hypothetical protein BJ165DRAFT_901945 [Panaeolus papilionaceus]